jgi:alkylation response protein AidB-like acyl-CoA dehydrogenase
MRDYDTSSALLEVARAFRPRIIAERDHIEAARRIPEDIAQDLAGAGFFRISLPEAYGGLDLRPMQAMEIFEELARADASVAWCVWNSNTHWTIAQLSPEAARTIHADPDVVTANSTRSSGQAQVVHGGYHVSGRWSMVSGCELGAWMVLLCIVHEDGKPRAPHARRSARNPVHDPPRHRVRDHRHMDGRRAARHRQPRCGGTRRIRADRLWVGIHRSTCPT